MKKFFLVIFLIFVLPLNAYAQTCISFLYINGSNIYDPKINKWYVNGLRKFHPSLRKAFEQDSCAQKYLLKNGEYVIKEAPVTYYWGDKNRNKYTYTKEELAASQGFISRQAYKIRLTVIHVLHDIIWVQINHNMNCVLDGLNEAVKIEVQKGNKILLMGYSSGSIIAYEYLLRKAPYINVSDLFNSADVSKEQRDFVSQHPMKNTCMSALTKDLAFFSADGHINFNNDINLFKKNYMNLNEQTAAVCMPENTILGAINLGSPMVLFYSDISDPCYQLTYYNRLLYKYIFEKDMFWLAVNYYEDPLSFPVGRNLSIEEIENVINSDIEPHAGFIYDESNVSGGISAMTHLSYLSKKRKKLTKAIVKAYIDGCRHQYDAGCPIDKCQKKLDIKP